MRGRLLNDKVFSDYNKKVVRRPPLTVPCLMLHFILFILLLLAYYVYNFYKNVRNFPPGPTPLPVVGNLHQIDLMQAHVYYTEMAKKYGPIFTVWLPRPHIILADYETIRETLSRNDDCAGRSGVFPDTAFQLTPNSGIIFSEGPKWKEQRRTSLQILRDFGMGKNIMETRVTSSAEECIKHLKSVPGEQKLDMRWPLQLCVGNIITEILFGWKYAYEDCEEFKEFVRIVERQFDSVKETPPFVFFIAQNFPSFLKFPGVKQLLTGRCMRETEKEQEMIRNFVGRCRKGYEISHEPECFVQAYLQRLDSTEYHDEDQLYHVCADFYAAGMETSTTTLRWALLYLAEHPTVQEKMRKEVESAIGDRLPSMSDKNRLPYTSAVIMEVQRICNLAPLAVNHKTMESMEMGGYSIPKNTIVIPLLYNVLLNSSVFKNGLEFQPERFLMADGVTPNKEAVEKNIPFGIGKRVCAGEGLARAELFIILTALIQNFKILPVPGKEIDFTVHVSVVLSPTNQELRLIPIDK